MIFKVVRREKEQFKEKKKCFIAIFHSESLEYHLY